MPAMRPRISGGIDSFHMVVRNIPLIASAPPPIARPSSTSHIDAEYPKRAMPRPHSAAAKITARPYLWTFRVHADVKVASSAPAGRPHSRSASAYVSWNRSATTGKARIIAKRSITYVPTMSGRESA